MIYCKRRSVLVLSLISCLHNGVVAFIPHWFYATKTGFRQNMTFFGLYYQNVCGIPHLKTPLFIIMNEQVSMCVTIYFNSFFAYDMRIKQSRDRKKKKERSECDKWPDRLHISLLFLSMNNRRPSSGMITPNILKLNGYAHMNLNDSNVMYNICKEKIYTK